MSRVVHRVLSLGVALLVTVGLGVTPAAADGVPLYGSLDTFVVSNDGGYSFEGWAFAADGGPVSLHIWDFGPTTTSARKVETFQGRRPDVQAVFGRANTGFEGWAYTREKGLHRICFFAVAVLSPGSTPLLLGCREIVAGRSPIGFVDGVQAQVIQGDPVTVRGWALDPDDPAASIPVHVYTDVGAAALTTGQSRPDLSAVIPGAGPRQGFQGAVPPAVFVPGTEGRTFELGRHSACFFAIGLGGGGNTGLGCRDFEVVPKVHSALDAVTFPSVGRVAVAGWSYLAGEPSVAAVTRLELQSIFVPEVFTTARVDVPANLPRPDVEAVFPGVGRDHGYSAATTEVIRPGPFRLCVTAVRGTVPLDADDPWGVRDCRYLEMPNAVGAVDSVTVGEAGAGTATIRGWAIDPMNPSVPVAVEGGLRPFSSSPLTFTDSDTQVTTVDRPDVNAALGISGAHGFEIVARIPAGFTGQVRAHVQLAQYASEPVSFASFARERLTIE